MADQNQKPNGEQDSPMLTDITFPNIGEPDEPEQTPETDVEARLRQMEERFAADQAAFNEERNRWQQTVDKLITQSAAPKQEAAAPAPEPVNFNDLPDPVDKPEEFKKALAQRFEREMSQRMTQQFEQYQQKTTSQQSADQQLDALWNKFQTDHADLASKTITLQGAILAEKTAMQQRGIDPQQGILANPDGFMTNVVTRMREELGMPAPGTQNSAPGGQQQQQPANRTGGVGAASRAQGAGPGKGKGPASFIDQLKKAQLDSGLI